MIGSRIIAQGLAFLLSASSGAAAETVVFDCATSSGTTEPLKIDFGAETATFGLGWPTPAIVTDETVSWSSRAQAADFTYTFNRRSGALVRTWKSDPPERDSEGALTCYRR